MTSVTSISMMNGFDLISIISSTESTNKSMRKHSQASASAPEGEHMNLAICVLGLRATQSNSGQVGKHGENLGGPLKPRGRNPCLSLTVEVMEGWKARRPLRRPSAARRTGLAQPESSRRHPAQSPRHLCAISTPSLPSSLRDLHVKSAPSLRPHSFC